MTDIYGRVDGGHDFLPVQARLKNPGFGKFLNAREPLLAIRRSARNEE
jgi:hypothetical protein